MASNLLSQQELEIYQNNEELSRLNFQDVLALKARLIAADYYHPHYDQAVRNTFNEAWDDFKDDVMTARIVPDDYHIDKATRQGHVVNIANRYKANGVDLEAADPQMLNDIARVVISDPGHEGEFGRTIDDRVQAFIEEDSVPEEQRIAVFQGVLRSHVDNSQGILEITGESDPEKIQALDEFGQQRRAYFTHDEHRGLSGTEDADRDADGQADAKLGLDTNNYGIRIDDADLYAGLDEQANGISQMQLMMIQGTLNMTADLDLSVDGLYGGQTANNIAEFDKYARDPDADFIRGVPQPEASEESKAAIEVPSHEEDRMPDMIAGISAPSTPGQ